MKIGIYKLSILLTITLMLGACAMTNPGVTQTTVIDPVCGRVVNLNESYDCRYEGKVYHFDTYECRAVFLMNPDKFIDQSKTWDYARETK